MAEKPHAQMGHGRDRCESIAANMNRLGWVWKNIDPAGSMNGELRIDCGCGRKCAIKATTKKHIK